MFTLRRELETILFILLASFVVLFFINQKNRQNQLPIVTSLPDSFEINAEPPATPTPAIETASEISSDGKMRVTMKGQDIDTATKTYSFFVSETAEDSQKQQLIFSQIVDLETSFFIPFNTFSTENKYLFLEKREKGKTQFLVFKVSGEAFAEGNKYIDVSVPFEKFTSEYTLYQVTGWSSGPYLIMESVKSDKTFGLSYWFNVMDESFIQLSSQF